MAYTFFQMGLRSKNIGKCLVASVLAATLAACGGGNGSTTSGTAFSPPASVAVTEFDDAAAQGANGALIDVSHASEGYVCAQGTSSSRLKLLVSLGDAAQNYDMPSDGSPIAVPLTSGNGDYTVRVMQNTTGNSYVELARATASAQMADEFAPFLLPNVYCGYAADSACVAKARELTADASTQADAVAAVCGYIVENVAYDEEKAAELSGSSGYVPDPDATLSAGKGICFDYASLGAAMLRSLGIPTRIVTGTVSPDNVYHAWIEVYIDGTWQSKYFDVEANTWSRLDLTFAAGGTTSYVGDGKTYTTRYVY